MIGRFQRCRSKSGIEIPNDSDKALKEAFFLSLSLSFFHILFVCRSFPPHDVSGRRRTRPPSPHPAHFLCSITLQQIYPNKTRNVRPLGHISCRGRRDRFERRLW